jgi:WD40 repeat protein
VEAGRGGAGGVSAEAAALANEVLRAIGVARVRAVVAVLLLAAAAVGAVGLAAGMHSREQPPPQPQAPVSVDRDEARPDGQTVELKPVLRNLPGGRPQGIRAAVLSPDGRTLAWSDLRTQLKLWSMETGTERTPFVRTTRSRLAQDPHAGFTHDADINCMAFTPDGKTLATGSMDRTVRLWDVESRAEKTTLWGHTFAVHSVAFSPDGKLLASGTGGMLGDSLDPRDPNLRATQADPASWVDQGEVKVWDLRTESARTFGRMKGSKVRIVVFSPDGKTLASGNDDGAVRLWDVATGKELACFHEGTEWVLAVSFSPDGKTLAVASDDLAPTLYRYANDLAKGKRPPATFTQKNELRLWDLDTGKVRVRLSRDVAPVRVKPDGRLESYPPVDFIAAAFGPDGILATAGGNFDSASGGAAKPSWQVRLRDGATGRPLGEPLPCDHHPSVLAFDPRGKFLAAWEHGSRDTGFTVWDLSPGGRGAGTR